MNSAANGNSNFKNLILIAGETNKDALDLSNFALSEIPTEVFSLRQLRRLTLANNQITNLPRAILQLENLEILDLNGNPIAIPDDLRGARDARRILEFYAAEIGFSDQPPNSAVKPPPAARAKPSGTTAQPAAAAAIRSDKHLESEKAADAKTGFLRRLLAALKTFFIQFPFIGKADSEAVVDFNINPRRMELEDRAKFWEAEYGPFLRPITEQHLSSYAAWRRISVEMTLTATIVLRTLACLVIWSVMGYFLTTLLYFVIGERWAVSWTRAYLFWILVWYVAGILPILVIALADGAFKLWRPFYTYEQRETFGTSKWMMPKQVHRSHKWLFRHQEPKPSFQNPFDFFLHHALLLLRKIYIGHLPSDPLKHNMFPVAPFGYGTWICYPLAQFARHLVLFGIPGSGKSASFIMSYVRSAASLGATFVMDIKGEMYATCAHYFKRVFRLDFEEAHKSDRFLMGRMLRRDYDFARTIAQSITNYDPDKPELGNNQFFRSNAAQLLAAMMLHLAEKNPDFSPADIFDLLEKYPADDKEKGLVPHLLTSPNKDTRQIIAGMPTRAAETFDGIMSNMTEGLQAFKDPHVIRVFTPPTAAEIKKGCQIFDPFLLRQKGTGCFMVITEGKAKRIGNVLSTVINITYNVLRRTGSAEECESYLPQHAVRMLSPSQIATLTEKFDGELAAKRGIARAALSTKVPADEYALLLSRALSEDYLKNINGFEAAQKPCFSFFIVDEAGNVSLTGLREKTGVGRAFRAAFILVYHNLAQMSVQFGRDYADAVKGTVGTRIFLPGLEGETAKYASFLLRRTTVLQRSGTDARNDNFDSTRLQEIARDLMTEDEVRTLLEYKQAVMVAFALRPMRIAFPREQIRLDPQITPAKEFSLPLVPPGLSAEIEEYQNSTARAKISRQAAQSAIEAAAGVDSPPMSGDSLKLPPMASSAAAMPPASPPPDAPLENETSGDRKKLSSEPKNSIRLAAVEADPFDKFFKDEAKKKKTSS